MVTHPTPRVIGEGGGGVNGREGGGLEVPLGGEVRRGGEWESGPYPNCISVPFAR